MGEKTVCPYKSHPYLIDETKECVSGDNICIEQEYPKIFNYVCYKNYSYPHCKIYDNTQNKFLETIKSFGKIICINKIFIVSLQSN